MEQKMTEQSEKKSEKEIVYAAAIDAIGEWMVTN